MKWCEAREDGAPTSQWIMDGSWWLTMTMCIFELSSKPKLDQTTLSKMSGVVRVWVNSPDTCSECRLELHTTVAKLKVGHNLPRSVTILMIDLEHREILSSSLVFPLWTRYFSVEFGKWFLSCCNSGWWIKVTWILQIKRLAGSQGLFAQLSLVMVDWFI